MSESEVKCGARLQQSCPHRLEPAALDALATLPCRCWLRCIRQVVRRVSARLRHAARTCPHNNVRNTF